MLSQDNRLKSSDDFRRVRQKGKVVQSSSFALAFYRRNDDNPPRFGFVVSTNISKNASKRNAIRRALAESLRHEIAFVKTGYDGVFLAKPEAVSKYMSVLMEEVKEVIKKAGLTK